MHEKDYSYRNGNKACRRDKRAEPCYSKFGLPPALLASPGSLLETQNPGSEPAFQTKTPGESPAESIDVKAMVGRANEKSLIILEYMTFI